jgi:hypothetical protein
MLGYRCVLAASLSLSLIFCHVPTVYAGHAPLGILTQAIHAHLDESRAFPGLSVFDGERLTTEVEGQLGVRVGRSTIALAARRTSPCSRPGGRTLIWTLALFTFRFQRTKPLKCTSRRPCCGPTAPSRLKPASPSSRRKCCRLLLFTAA